MTYYKAFKKGMVCNGKQYAENTDFEEQGAESCCQAGVMHFCKEPFDVLNYYPLVDENGDFSEFATVEPLDAVIQKEDKCASKKIHIGAKLSFKDFIKAAVDVVIEKTKGKGSDNSSWDYAQIGSSWDYAQIGSSWDGAQIGSSGDYAQIGSSGDYAQIGSSGYSAQIGSSGNYAQIGSSGNRAKIKMDGNRSVAACVGNNGAIKGKKGCWIVLAEWENVDGEYTPVCVKAAQIDGETLKEDTFYKLENGEFVEAQ